jgi:hypothetical protein
MNHSILGQFLSRLRNAKLLMNAAKKFCSPGWWQFLIIILYYPAKGQNYDESLVTWISQNGQLDAVVMSRKGGRIKAKYFAGKLRGKSVQERYHEWAKGRNIIMYTNGAYSDANGFPVGLTVDQGEIVNRNLENFDGLVIIDSAGGVIAANLKEGNLEMLCEGKNQPFDLRNGGDYIRQKFLDCASKGQANVFQTHLLIFKDKLLSGKNSSPNMRERRFLAVCQNPTTNEYKHIIVQIPYTSKASLKDASENSLKVLRSNGAGKVIFLINLDTGSQDVFKFFDANGNIKLSGTRELDVAANLLVYYYE